jgi:hypothetical protein
LALGKTRRTGGESFCRIAQVILCSLLIVIPCACSQPAKPSVSSDVQKPSQAPDTQPAKLQATDHPAKSGGDSVVGDDIGIGLAGSIRLQDPSFDGDGGPRERVAERDGKMHKLKAFLASRPTSSASIECFIGDASFAAHGCVHSEGTVLLYYSNALPENDVSWMASLGFVRVAETDWRTMRPWMIMAATRKAPWIPRISDVWDVTVFSYYDGRQWRIAPWFYLTYVPEMRDPTETDIAVFSLIEYVTCKLQPPLTFASHFRGHIMTLYLEKKADIEENLKQGRRWDDFDQKKAPEPKPEEKPEAKSPAVAPK